MAEVNISVGGRSYRLVCRNGEEDALQAAGDYLDIRATSIRDSLGAVGEARLLLMAALQVTGELLIEQQSGVRVQSGESNDISPEFLSRLEALAKRTELLAERLETAAGAS